MVVARGVLRFCLALVFGFLGLVPWGEPELQEEIVNASEPSHSHAGWIAFSAYREGNWDIYTVRADGAELRRITFDEAQDMSPAWSSDGTSLAFQSNRGGNWDIYSISESDGVVQRLTSDPHYDGAPCWSPDGSRIAFESYREGDLDVFVMNADGTEQTDLTPTSSAGDFDPAWSPDGSRLAFTSWRMGDNDIFLMDLSTLEVEQWTSGPMPEGNAVWSHDGSALAYVTDWPARREIYLQKTVSLAGETVSARRLTWFSRDDSPVLMMGDSVLAYISHQHTNQDAEYLVTQSVGDSGSAGSSVSSARVIVAGWGDEIAGPLSWTSRASELGEIVTDFVNVNGSFSPTLARDRGLLSSSSGDDNNSLSKKGFEDLMDVNAPNARLDARLVQSFERIRGAIRDASGYDFLADLSDMWRGLDAQDEGSAYLSWHKAGRAFDTLFDYRDESNHPLMEVVREDTGGETFWRIFLKTKEQDGSMGMPLKVHPWDLSGAMRRKHPADGGWWKAIPYGYYVDVSRIIRDGGWERISAIDRPDFSWRWHFLAIEYWHHQVREGSSWYQAVEDVYSPDRMSELFDWLDLVRSGERPYNLFGNAIPIPPSYAEWHDVKS